MTRSVRIVRLLFILGTLTSALKAQVTTATIYGTVLDPTSAAVSRAEITLTNEANGVTHTATSNDVGEFTLTFLPIGRYRLTVKSQGFKTATESGIMLAAGQRITRTFNLEVGAVTDTLSVTEQAPLVNTVTPEQRETYVTGEITELPLFRRDWTSVLGVSAGTRVNGPKVIFNGLAQGAFSFTVDGTRASGSSEDTNLASWGDFNYIKGVSMEAIAEVHVSKGIASAEIADTLSGNLEVITKSGTNKIHGSLFENYLGRVLNARNQFLATRPPEVYNQFGGSLGGPIVKNKLFMFGAYEGYRQRRFTSFNTNVATSEFRNQMIAAVPAYKMFFDTQPLPNQAYNAGAIVGRYIGFGSNAANDNHVVLRGDYYLDSNNFFSARYTRGRPNSLTPRAQVMNPRTFDGKTEVVTAAYTHTRAASSLQTRFGYNFNDVARSDGFIKNNIATIDGSLGFSDSGELLASKGTGWSSDTVFALTLARHSIKLGGIYYYQDTSRVNQVASSVTYSSAADMLANIPSSVSLQFGLNPSLISDWNTWFFIQDDFRVTPRLILNL
ncbi:MAG: carboxypeptidase-like regulatory domain-containing protein, partial [Bryobacteraceae bacterium]